MTRTRRLTFWEHLEELRARLLVVVASVLVFAAIGYVAYPQIYTIVAQVIQEELFATRITEGFVARLRSALLVGVFFSLPAILIEITLFVFPALTKRERRYVIGVVIATFLLFVGGVAFAYAQVLPVSMAFLKSREFYPQDVGRLISYQAYLTFFFQFLIGFGICFQFPSVILLMARLGLVEPRSLVSNFKYFVIGAAVVSAIITPPDVVSQLLLTAPLIVLYALCIPFAYLIVRRRE